MLAELDHRTGQLLDALDEAGVSGDTVVVWSGDNDAGARSAGVARTALARPLRVRLRGRHARAPAVVRWPGKVDVGTVSGEILCAVDWLTTLASLVGESGGCPTTDPSDGVDAVSLWLAKNGVGWHAAPVSYG
jgi:arylsulfatase A-like enzyme